MLCADDACIVSRSPRGLGWMMAVFVEIFDTFGMTISESTTETMYMPTPHAPATKIVFNATGQQHGQTTSFTYLGGTVTETPNLSDEIYRGVDELQVIYAGAVRPPEGKSATPEGPDGEVRCNRGSCTDARNRPPWRVATPSPVQLTIACFFEF